MAYNDSLAKRIRASIEVFSDEFTEKKMFGGLVFLYTLNEWKFVNFRNFIFFFPKAKLTSIAIATVDNFNAGKGKKKDIKTRVFIR